MAEYQHPELVNLALTLEEKEVAEIGETVSTDFRSDCDDMSGWNSIHADWQEMYYQRDNAMNPPWEGSSQESLPILAEACNQYHARSYQAMFGNKQIVTGVPTGKSSEEDRDRAERVSLHMDWQLTVKDKTYKKNKDRLLLALPLHGSFFTKAYYSADKRRNVVDNVRPTDLIVPYGTGPRDIEDLERKTQVIWMPVFKTAHLAATGFLKSPALPYTKGDTAQSDKVHEDAHGIQQTRPHKGPSKMLECHCYLDLDEDGLAEPYIVTYDAQDDDVKRIAPRWTTDPAGNPTDEFGQPVRQITMAGPYFKGKKHTPKNPIEYFTHYSFLENPDGFYGLGLGHLLGPPNRAVNKLLRQIIDASTLATAGNMSGMISSSIAVPGGEFDMVMGKFKKVPVSGEDLQKGVFQFKFPGPNQSMFDALALMMQRSDRLGTSTEAVTGQTDAVMQPTAILSLLEEAGRMFSAVNERTVSSWNGELGKLYRLNATFMDPAEYYSVIDADGQIIQREVHKSDYAADLEVKPTVDPQMSTRREKIAQAEAEWNFEAQNPLVQQSPLHFYNASKRFLRALGAENIEEVLPSPDWMGMLAAALKAAGLPDEMIEEFIGQVGIAVMAEASGNALDLSTLGEPLPGAPLENGQPNGATPLTGAERSN